MGRIFWNEEERRTRAGWRFALHTILLLSMTIGLAFASQGDDTVRSIAQMTTPIASALIAAKFLDRRKITDLGFRCDARWWIDLGAGVALGALLIAIIFGCAWIAGWAHVRGVRSGWALIALPLLAPSLVNAFSEEIWFRAYYVKNFSEGMSRLGPPHDRVMAIVLSSILFGLAHAGNTNATPLAVLGLVGVGVLFSVAYTVARDQLAMCTGLHAAWNFVQGHVFPLYVSGTEPQHPLIDATVDGPSIFTGGAFGPEGGLLVFVAVAIGIAVLFAYRKLQIGPAQ